MIPILSLYLMITAEGSKAKSVKWLPLLAKEFPSTLSNKEYYFY